MKNTYTLCIAIASACIAGCATMPHVTATYYFPQAQTKLTVTQTFGCNAAKNYMVAATDVIAATSYSANPDQTATIEYSKFGGQLKDSDVTLNLTPDGRLSGINSVFNGEGAAIIKDVATLASSVSLIVFNAAYMPDNRDQQARVVPVDSRIKDDCDTISQFAAAKAGGDAKAVTTVSLTYSLNLLYSANASLIKPDPDNNAIGYPSAEGTQINFLPDPDSEAIFSQLKVIKDRLFVRDEAAPQRGDAVSMQGVSSWDDRATAPSGYTWLKLNRVGMTRLTVYGPSSDFSTSAPVWRSDVAVPLQVYYPCLCQLASFSGNSNSL